MAASSTSTQDRPVTEHARVAQRHVDPHRYPQGVAFLDGQYLPMSEAKVSVLDWGFLHSDATYDTVHVWQSAFFRLDLHLDRFFGGLERLRMVIPTVARRWCASCTSAWRCRATATPMSR
jgi:hypothetical protein